MVLHNLQEKLFRNDFRIPNFRTARAAGTAGEVNAKMGRPKTTLKSICFCTLRRSLRIISLLSRLHKSSSSSRCRRCTNICMHNNNACASRSKSECKTFLREEFFLFLLPEFGLIEFLLGACCWRRSTYVGLREQRSLTWKLNRPTLRVSFSFG